MTAPSIFSLLDPLPSGRTAVEASAGTGKTYTLASLVVRYVAEAGVPIDEILIVTFTRAAAAELRDRVRSRLIDAVAALKRPPEQPLDDAFFAVAGRRGPPGSSASTRRGGGRLRRRHHHHYPWLRPKNARRTRLGRSRRPRRHAGRRHQRARGRRLCRHFGHRVVPPAGHRRRTPHVVGAPTIRGQDSRQPRHRRHPGTGRGRLDARCGAPPPSGRPCARRGPSATAGRGHALLR